MRIARLGRDNSRQIIKEVKTVLKRDGLVVFPSDTVYGLAANARSAQAVEKLLHFKDRPRGQSVSIAVKDYADIARHVEATPQQMEVLKTILPGPFTIVLPSKGRVSPRLEAEDGTLGVRLPDFGFIRKLSQTLDFPYTATSANLHGKGPHYSVPSLLHTLSRKKTGLLDLVIDDGELPRRLPSTVVNLTGTTVQTLRQGDVDLELVKRTDSQSEEQTKDVAKELLQTYLNDLKTQPLVFVLKGDLGAGKTVFAKGIGEYFGIDNVISPTFVLYYEYNLDREPAEKLHHFDLYRAETPEDMEVLGIDELLKSGQVLVFEWGEKIGSTSPLLSQKKITLFFVNIKEKGVHSRHLEIYRLRR